MKGLLDRLYVLDGHYVRKATSMAEWGACLDGGIEQRRVGNTVILGCEVSTVFLGLDHNWFGSGDPLLFGTMVFTEEGTGTMRRYFTWAEAEAGHAEVVAAIQTAAERAEALTLSAIQILLAPKSA